MPEQFYNNVSGLLDGGIDDSQTSFDIKTHNFPTVASNTIRAKIDDEIIIISALASDTVTCTRGAESTTAASHSDNTAITHVLTSGSLEAVTAVQYSITRDSGGLKLVGDSTPMSNQHYGTNDGGTLGYFDLRCPLHAITPAQTSHSIDNGSSAQTWDWSALTGSTNGAAFTIQLNGLDHLAIGNDGSAERYYAKLGTGSASTDVSIGTSGGKVGFLGASPIEQTYLEPITVGSIESLTFSSTPTQAECEALRDAVETVATNVNAIADRLTAFGLIYNSV